MSWFGKVPAVDPPAVAVERTSVDRASAALLMALIGLTGVSLPIMSVALPALGEAFPTWSRADLSWVTNIFTIVGAASMLPAGVLADRIGRKPMVIWGTAVFLVGSILGAIAPSPGFVIVARAVQSLGASAFTPAGVALMVASFPPDKLATAMGTWAVGGGTASAAGPGLGGMIIDGLGWRWAFWCVVPLSAVVLALGPRVLHEPMQVERDRRRFPDPIGVALVVLSASLLTFGLVKGPGWGWTSGRTLACLAAGLLLGGYLAWRVFTVAVPLIDPGLLRIRAVQQGNLGIFVFAGSWFGMFFGLVLFLRTHWEWSLLQSGMATAPIPLFAGLVGVWSGRRADQVGHRKFIVPGALVHGVGALWLGLALTDQPSFARLLPGVLIAGVASGLVFPSMQAVAMHGVPAEAHAAASALNFTSQRLAITFGVALVIGMQGEGGDLGPVIGVMVVGAIGALLIGLGIDTRRGSG